MLQLEQGSYLDFGTHERQVATELQLRLRGDGRLYLAFLKTDSYAEGHGTYDIWQTYLRLRYASLLPSTLPCLGDLGPLCESPPALVTDTPRRQVEIEDSSCCTGAADDCRVVAGEVGQTGCMYAQDLNLCMRLQMRRLGDTCQSGLGLSRGEYCFHWLQAVASVAGGWEWCGSELHRRSVLAGLESGRT